MAERIIGLPTEKMATDLRFWLREEVVRCRDCVHYVVDPEPIDPGWPMMCDESGRDMLEPDGFCAWACRRTE